MATAEKSSKVLVVFDFDHTVIDGNSDVVVQELHPQPFPEGVNNLLTVREGWTEYMGAIFSCLHSNGVKEHEIKNNILTIPVVDGMMELFELLRHEKFEVIIISDANTVFIDWLIKEKDIHGQIKKVYSNPAQFDNEGKLTIQYYHHQDWCNLSPRNMCKGHIMENHITERKSSGVSYSNVVYVGDGGNDYCPSIRLSANDYVFPREGFVLVRKLKENSSKVKARIVPWSSGKEILDHLKTLTDL